MSDKKTNAVRIAEKNKVKYELLSYEVDEEHLDAISVAEKINEEIKYVYKTLVLLRDRKSVV